MADEIDVAAATEAMNAAGGVETLLHGDSATITAPPQTVPTPTPASDQQQGGEAAQPAEVVPGLKRDPVTGRWVRADQVAPAPQSTEQPTANEPFTNVDPNTLSPELQSIYKSLQADYTRKTQEIAQQRSQFEQLGPMDEIQQAISIYNQLQDPQAWPQLHAELTEGMKALGLSQGEAEAAATEALVQQATPATGDPFAALGEDPELAPVKTAYQQLQQQLTELQTQFQQQNEAQQAEQLQMAVLGEFQRQENIIRQQNPHYNDEDVKAIYELSSYHEGNLLQAQQRYDQIFNDRLAAYLNGKQGVADHMPLVGGGEATTHTPAVRPKTLDEGHAMAMEALRQIEAGVQ